MPEEVYDQRENTVRRFLQKQREEQKSAASSPPSSNSSEKEDNLPSHITIESRCEVGPGARRGKVKFLGKVPALGNEVWVGVELDEPLGKNDGSVNGVRLFTCAPNHGVLAKPDRVVCGDFPVRDPFGEDSDEEI